MNLSRPLILGIISLFSIIGYTQEPRYAIRLGVGPSFLGTGDMSNIMGEAEFNVKLNKYFTLSEGVGFGKSYRGVFREASFFQVNSNIFISPFRNNRKNDFRIGTGISWYAIEDSRPTSSELINGELIMVYEKNQRNAFGINIILEHTYQLSERLTVGAKLFAQPYFNGDRNSGLLFKFGYRF